MYSWYKLYFSPRLLVILALGFVSGLPLALSASTLSVWLAEAKIDLSTIGLFALVGMPYTLKFLWSPLIDGLQLPLFTTLFGRRRGWMIAMQLLLMVNLIMLGLCNPTENLLSATFFAFSIAAFSATQDIVIDAYRVEILPTQEQGAGVAMMVLGYRLGMITSAAGALFLATEFGWQITYAIMAGLIPIAWLAVFVGGEPQVVDSGQWIVNDKKEPQHTPYTIHHILSVWFTKHVIEPFTDFIQREAWLGILLFILLYKLSDAFIGVMVNPFLIDIGFTKNQIATVVKFYGLIATIIGSFIGGMLVVRIGMIRTLWICGIAHALTNLMFVVQTRIGADEEFLSFSIALENISGGMGTAAFVAFISSLVNLRFTATQYALLSSFSAFGRTWLSAPSGWFAKKLGWELFFILSVLLAIPGLITLWWLSKKKLIQT